MKLLFIIARDARQTRGSQNHQSTMLGIAALLSALVACGTRPVAVGAENVDSGIFDPSVDSALPVADPAAPISPQSPSGTCAVAIRMESCCPSIEAVTVAQVNADPMLAPYGTKDVSWTMCDSCIYPDPPTRSVAMVDGECDFVSECADDDDCVIAKGLGACCPSSASWPQSAVDANLEDCLGSVGDPLPSSCTPPYECGQACGPDTAIGPYCLAGDQFSTCTSETPAEQGAPQHMIPVKGYTPCGAQFCDAANEVCVVMEAWSTTFSCQRVPEQCRQDRSCDCLSAPLCGDYVDPNCRNGGSNRIQCGCPNC